jgi:hypothetical protein
MPTNITGDCGPAAAAMTERAASRIRPDDPCAIFIANSKGGQAWELRRDVTAVRMSLPERQSGRMMAATTPRRDHLILIVPGRCDRSPSARAIFRGIRKAQPDAVVATAASLAGPADAVAASEEAHQVLHVACALGSPAGMYGLEDVLMETALIRSPDLAFRLASALEPLEGNTTPLLETLASFLESNQDRKVAAARLHIHPNTLIYRLQRIHELTGLSPTVVKDVRRLWLAVAAWRLTRETYRGQFAG